MHMHMTQISAAKISYCLRLSSGLSATHLRQSTRDNDVSGRISNPNGGPPRPGPSAVHFAQPPEMTKSLDKILDSTAECPLSKSGPSAVQPCGTHQR